MKVIKAAILGFGTVGKGVFQIIETHQTKLQEVFDAKIEVVAVLVQDMVKKRSLAESILLTTNFEDILNLPQVDVVFEAIVGEEPGFTYLKKAIRKGCHVITANKEMFAEHGEELLNLAEENGVRVGFEATVAGGVPIIQTMQHLLRVNNVESVQGILNGTSNFILSEMRNKRCSFEEALLIAQKKGYAEANPENDIGGWDAYFKLRILSRVSFCDSLKQMNLPVSGIENITIKQILIAETLGLRFKHIAEVKKVGERLKASVRAILVPESHPFYQVEGVENAVTLLTDLLGNLTLQGPGAGMLPTASAMIEDFIQIQQFAVLKTEKQRKRVSFEYHSEECSPRYWLASGLTEDSILNEIEICRVYPENVHVIKAPEARLKKLEKAENSISFYPIMADERLLLGFMEKEFITVNGGGNKQ